jgi:hypothetical protein
LGLPPVQNPIRAVTIVNYQADPNYWRSILGLFAIGTHPAIMVKAPFKIPEVPIPATARPIINILEEMAMPQIKEPNSKMAKKAMKVHYI